MEVTNLAEARAAVRIFKKAPRLLTDTSIAGHINIYHRGKHVANVEYTTDLQHYDPSVVIETVDDYYNEYVLDILPSRFLTEYAVVLNGAQHA